MKLHVYFRLLASHLGSDDTNIVWNRLAEAEIVRYLLSNLVTGTKDIAVYVVDELEAELFLMDFLGSLI